MQSFLISLTKPWLATAMLFASMYSQTTLTPEEIIVKVDANLFSESRRSEVRMIIHGERGAREMSLRVYSVGDEKSYSEFLAPKREQGVKMLKLDDRLWIYSPTTDRTIQLSGHLLRQSMMGSDISYEDMMEDRRLLEVYSAKMVNEEALEIEVEGKRQSRNVYVMELIAKVENVNYAQRKLWVDQEYFLPLKEELYAKSGVLLKRLTFSDLVQIDNRWLAKRMKFKDILKRGEGTEMIIDQIEFNPRIPDRLFNKSVLRR